MRPYIRVTHSCLSCSERLNPDPTNVARVHFNQGIAMVPRGRNFIVGCSDGDVFAFQAKVKDLEDA